MIKKFGKGLIIVLTIIFVFISLKDIQTIEASKTIETEEVVYSVNSFPETLASIDNMTKVQSDIICSVFEGLVEQDENSEILPALCKGWKISEDKLEYDFLLKDDIKWSDGSKITSKDFVEFFKNLLSKDNKSYTLDELYSVYGVREYKEGKMPFKDVAIKASNDTTLTFRMNKKDDDFLKKLSKPIYRLREYKNQLVNYKNQFNLIKYSGPYVISSIKSDEEIVLEKNNEFDLNENSESIKKIVFKKNQGEEVDFAAFNLGKIDIISNPPITAFEHGELGKKIYTKNSNILKMMFFNSSSDVAKFLDFRNAMCNYLKLDIMDNSLIKNKAAIPIVELNTIESIKKLEFPNIKEDVLDNNEKREIYNSQANRLLEHIEVDKREIDLLAIDNNENRILTNFLQKVLKDKSKISLNIILCDEEKFQKNIKENKYDICICDIYTKNKENIEKSLEDLNLNKNNNDLALSLYYKNSIWCKSQKIKYLYIDGNENILFKYIETN